MRFSELMSECDCMLQFLPAKKRTDTDTDTDIEALMLHKFNECQLV